MLELLAVIVVVGYVGTSLGWYTSYSYQIPFQGNIHQPLGGGPAPVGGSLLQDNAVDYVMQDVDGVTFITLEAT
jgi:hypothetical protein